MLSRVNRCSRVERRVYRVVHQHSMARRGRVALQSDSNHSIAIV